MNEAVFDDPQDGHVDPDDLDSGDPGDIPEPGPEDGVPVGPGTDTPAMQEAA